MYLDQLVIKATDLEAAAMFAAANLDSSMYESATVTLTLRPKGWAKYKEARKAARLQARRDAELRRIQVGQLKMAQNLGIPVQDFLSVRGHPSTGNPGGPDLPFDTGNPEPRQGTVNTLGTGSMERIDVTPKGRRAVDDMPIGDFWSGGHAG